METINNSKFTINPTDTQMSEDDINIEHIFKHPDRPISRSSSSEI